MVAHEQESQGGRRGPRVDDKMLINGLWGLVVLLLGGIVTWLVRETRSLWKALHAQDKRTEEQISRLAEATNVAIGGLHEKSNRLAREMAEAQFDGERNHASKDDLRDMENRIREDMKGLTTQLASMQQSQSRRG